MDKAFPSRALKESTDLFVQCHALADRIAAIAAEIVAHVWHDETARRLMTMPGIGQVGISHMIRPIWNTRPRRQHAELPALLALAIGDTGPQR